MEQSRKRLFERILIVIFRESENLQQGEAVRPPGLHPPAVSDLPLPGTPFHGSSRLDLPLRGSDLYAQVPSRQVSPDRPHRIDLKTLLLLNDPCVKSSMCSLLSLFLVSSQGKFSKFQESRDSVLLPNSTPRQALRNT